MATPAVALVDSLAAATASVLGRLIIPFCILDNVLPIPVSCGVGGATRYRVDNGFDEVLLASRSRTVHANSSSDITALTK